MSPERTLLKHLLMDAIKESDALVNTENTRSRSLSEWRVAELEKAVDKVLGDWFGES